MNYSLRRKLLQMLAKDQALRKKGIDTSSLDRENVIILKQILQQYGWPTYQLVGKKGAYAAWIIVQHADSSLAFQKYCLTLLQRALHQSQANPIHLAYLTDRILVHKGKKQLYGTQFYLDKKGIFRPRPIIQKATLDQRRLKMGLRSFKEYTLEMEKVYSQFRHSQ